MRSHSSRAEHHDVISLQTDGCAGDGHSTEHPSKQICIPPHSVIPFTRTAIAATPEVLPSWSKRAKPTQLSRTEVTDTNTQVEQELFNFNIDESYNKS